MSDEVSIHSSPISRYWSQYKEFWGSFGKAVKEAVQPPKLASKARESLAQGVGRTLGSFATFEVLPWLVLRSNKAEQVKKPSNPEK